MNEKANWAARSTLFWDVTGALNWAVRGAMRGTVLNAVDWTVYLTVDAAVEEAVHWTLEDDPNHPGLEDFLHDVER